MTHGELNSKKRVTYVLHDIAIGGVEVALISAIPALMAQYSLTIIVLGKIDARMIAHLNDNEKSVFKSLDFPLSTYPFRLFFLVGKILKSKPDILICSLWRSALLGTLAKYVRRHIRFYAFVHNTAFPHLPARYFNERAAKAADVVLTDSVATKVYVEAKFTPKAPVRVVSFLTRPTPIKRSKDLPIAGEEVRFIFLGRINKVKNLPAAIDLIQYLQKKSINATLDIFGRNDDGTEDILKQYVAANGLGQIIRFKGEVTGADKWNVFRPYHLYVQLSFAEGMAMSVTEAMQNGLVCIVSPVGEIPNYASDMQSAVFVDANGADRRDDQFEKVLRVVTDPKIFEMLSQNAHAHFLSQRLYSDSLIEQIEL
ncbi:hypothetical protein DYBT9623_02638 [Dyadobacter sp. CECT 9623]|uniref:Uncharacterized protein n=1 Tax=Dyadobacter linearis TaxID=2823330 RepID=A0ABM8UQY9_9BACT|nr:glycosyltransferase family 4 protein [Dyadobacter sp. CECT 9623]CAG5069901.1 hypothetical protein DYBT9623_02638 [Dyadobacter sp. CECT 9623]